MKSSMEELIDGLAIALYDGLVIYIKNFLNENGEYDQNEVWESQDLSEYFMDLFMEGLGGNYHREVIMQIATIDEVLSAYLMIIIYKDPKHDHMVSGYYVKIPLFTDITKYSNNDKYVNDIRNTLKTLLESVKGHKNGKNNT